MVDLKTTLEILTVSIALYGAGLSTWLWRESARKEKPLFNIRVEKTTSADYYLRFDFKNQRKWPITIQCINILKPEDIDAALFDIWPKHDDAWPAFSLSTPPVELSLDLNPGQSGGCAFLISGPVNDNIKSQIEWLDRSRKIKEKKDILIFPQHLLPTNSTFDLEKDA